MAAPAAAEGSEVRQLLEQRAEAEKMIETAKSIMAAGSFRARAEAYCRSAADERTALMSPGVDAEYRKLLAAEPATREEELARQYRLAALQEVIVARAVNAHECQNLALMGAQPIPDDEMLREKAARAQQVVDTLDQQIAALRR